MASSLWHHCALQSPKYLLLNYLRHEKVQPHIQRKYLSGTSLLRHYCFLLPIMAVFRIQIIIPVSFYPYIFSAYSSTCWSTAQTFGSSSSQAGRKRGLCSLITTEYNIKCILLWSASISLELLLHHFQGCEEKYALHFVRCLPIYKIMAFKLVVSLSYFQFLQIVHWVERFLTFLTAGNL